MALDDIEPRIWRRIEVPSDVRLDVLHDILQAAMGWTDSHLHVFEAGTRRFGTHEDENPTDDETSATLAEVAPEPGSSLRYWYDFGDDWWHTITVERVTPPSSAVTYPQCTDGARACPPEDCGGPPGYLALLAVLADTHHPQHDEMSEWAGPEFDPERFSARQATELIQVVAGARRLHLAPPRPRASSRAPARTSRPHRRERRAVPWLVGQRSLDDDGLGVATVVLTADGEALTAAADPDARLSLVMALSDAHRKVPSGKAPPPSLLVAEPGLVAELRHAATGFSTLRRVEVVADAALPNLDPALSSLAATLRAAASADECGPLLLPFDGNDGIDREGRPAGGQSVGAADDEVLTVIDLVPDGTTIQASVVPVDEYARIRPAGGVRLAFPLGLRLPGELAVVYLGARGAAAVDLCDRLLAAELSMVAVAIPPGADSGLLVIECRYGVVPLGVLNLATAEAMHDAIVHARGAAVVAVADLRGSAQPRAVSSVFELVPGTDDLAVLRALPARSRRGGNRRR